jgi:hypothetical protein
MRCIAGWIQGIALPEHKKWAFDPGASLALPAGRATRELRGSHPFKYRRGSIMIGLRHALFTSVVTCSLASAMGCAEGVDPVRSEPATSTGNGGGGGGSGFPGTGLTVGSSGGSLPLSSGGSTPSTGGGGVTNGGASGSAGSGGTLAGNGGATGNGGSQQTVDAGPPAVGVLVGQYKVPPGESPTDENLVAHLKIDNRSDHAIPVAALTIRYWYTIDGTAPATSDYQVIELNYADIGRISGGTTSVKLSFAKMAKPQKGADTYFEVGFVGPFELAANTGTTNQIEVRAHWNGYTPKYNETNDYSWNGSITSWTDWRKVTVYQNGVLVWGTEPDGTTPKAPGDGGADSGGSTDGAPRGTGGSAPRDAGRG